MSCITVPTSPLLIFVALWKIFQLVSQYISYSPTFISLKEHLKHLSVVRKYKAKVENQFNRKIKVFHSDNGKVYFNKEFDDYLKTKGIIHQKTNPYILEQNGLAEGFNRTAIEESKMSFVRQDSIKKDSCQTRGQRFRANTRCGLFRNIQA